jgi:hypothetical protein
MSRIGAGPVLLVVTGLAFASLLAFTRPTNPSYACDRSAFTAVLDPAPEDRNGIAFDSGHACNVRSRERVAGAAAIVIVGLAAAGFWSRRQLRAGK